MTKEEIQKRIYELSSDEEIKNFVLERIKELEENSKEVTVGQGYTDTFRDYISSKVHYKPAASFKDAECPDLVYDDIEPYISLIKDLKEASWYNEMTLFSTIFFSVYHYLPSEDLIGLGRTFLYIGNKGKQLSIKDIKESGCAFCSEKTGLAHNMFKFLGVDSEVVCGYRNNEGHAYNFIYPNGYENEPIVIYDVSHFVSFKKGDEKLSFGYFKAMRRSDYEQMMNKEGFTVDLGKTEQNYRKLYQLDDSYTFAGDTPTYYVGLDRNLNLDESVK